MVVAPDLPLNDPDFYASDPFGTYRVLREETRCTGARRAASSP